MNLFSSLLETICRVSLIGILLFGAASSATEVKSNDPEPAEAKAERFAFGVNGGVILPSTVGGASYSVSPAIGLSFEFKPNQWISVGASTYSDILISKTSGANSLFEGALLPQVLFYLADTGLYAGIRAGLSDISVSQESWTALYFVFVWGPEVGYQYRFANSRFSIGPEFNYTFISSGTSANSDPFGGTSTLASHQHANCLVMGKAWF